MPEMKDVLAAAQAGKLREAYVLVGEETLLLDRAVRALREAIAKDDVTGLNQDLFDGRATDADRVISAAQTLPMMARARFVLVRGVEAMKPADLDALAGYLEAPSPTTCLVLTGTKVDGRSRLAKIAKKHGQLVEAKPLRGGAVRAFVEAEARRRGHTIDSQASHGLLDAIGEDLAQLDDALERLSLYVGPGKPIDAAAIEACVTRVRVDTIWALVDAVGLRDRATVLRAAGTLLADREPPLRILAMVARQLRMVARMREALASGLKGEEAAAAAGAPPFKARDMAEAARRFDLDALGRAFETLANADRSLKGSRQQGERILEDALLQLCR